MANKAKQQTILIVDDDEIVRKILVHSLEKADYYVIEANNGEEGLREIQRNLPDLVITDIQMPIMNGMELMSKINELLLPVPVIAITGKSRVEDVINTLRLGVRDFIRKPFESTEMLAIIHKVLNNPIITGSEDELIPYVRKETKAIYLPNDQNVLNMASYYLTRNLPLRGFCSQIEKENIRHALFEALINAMIHGNLELSSELKNVGGIADTAFNAILQERLATPPYGERMTKVLYRFTREKLLYRIEDQGPGFDYKNLPDPLTPENIFKPFGRGIFFIQLHMDKIYWNSCGNAMTMVRFRQSQKQETRRNQ